VSNLVREERPRDVATLCMYPGQLVPNWNDMVMPLTTHREGEREHLGPQLVGGEPRRVARARVADAEVEQ